jgi:hypothetical protein
MAIDIRDAMQGVDIDKVHRRYRMPAGVDQQGRLPACGGPCDNGNKLCPSPEACQRCEDDDGLGAARGIIVGVVCMLAFWCAVVAFLVALK